MGDLILNTFNFIDPDGRDSLHCQTTITVTEEKDFVSNCVNWKLKLDSQYSNGNKITNFLDPSQDRACHPMSDIQNRYLNYKGFTVIKNEMTTKMIEYLMMNDNELASESRTITPQSYRRKVIKNLMEYID